MNDAAREKLDAAVTRVAEAEVYLEVVSRTHERKLHAYLQGLDGSYVGDLRSDVIEAQKKVIYAEHELKEARMELEGRFHTV